MILKETGRNRKKQEDTGRNRKKQEETVRSSKKNSKNQQERNLKKNGKKQ